ncbi:MAG: bacteriohopanetetrol glucosamine biosynthesis glycosyltransferase HpnI [Alphaproteobacteria bacterium]
MSLWNRYFSIGSGVHEIQQILGYGLLGMSLVGVAYLVVAAWAVAGFARERSRCPAPDRRPPVTILKPVCGDEPGLYENLLSFCTQDYPQVQVLFGVRDPKDTAVATVRRIQATLPEADISLVVDPRLHGANYKVSNLINMMAVARHPILVVADSDMHVGMGYLDAVVAALLSPGVGAVTCLYTGRSTGNLWSTLGAAWINIGFLPSVLVGRIVGGVDGCFGATMALERTRLEEIGGFEALKDHLADDYALGVAVRRLGLKVVLAPCIPDHLVTESDGRELFLHELRWSRTIAAIAPVSFAASVVTHPVVLCILALAFLGFSPLALTVLAVALGGRFITQRWICRTLGLERFPAWLIVPRDILSFVTLVGAFSGRSVTWRGREFRIGRDGLLLPK